MWRRFLRPSGILFPLRETNVFRLEKWLLAWKRPQLPNLYMGIFSIVSTDFFSNGA